MYLCTGIYSKTYNEMKANIHIIFIPNHFLCICIVPKNSGKGLIPLYCQSDAYMDSFNNEKPNFSISRLGSRIPFIFKISARR